MDSNTITNPTKGIVKSPKLSHLTNDQLLKAMQYDMVEEYISPYIVDIILLPFGPLLDPLGPFWPL